MRSALLVLRVLLVMLVVVVAGQSATAQETPEASGEEGAPGPRYGRLGGSVGQFKSMHGEPTDEEPDQLEYLPFSDLSADLTARVYKRKLFEISVTWVDANWPGSEEEARSAVTSAVSLLAPADGACETDAVENGLGEEVYLCHSGSLAEAYSLDSIRELGFEGEQGDYYYAVEIDEEDGQAFLVIGVGHDVYTAPTPTPVPPTPTPTLEEKLAQYPPLPDVRELAIRTGNMIGERFWFAGTILSIQVAPPGEMFALGDDDVIPASVAMQVTVLAPDGSSETIFVAYSGDTTGMFEGSYVIVYGEVVGTQSFLNLMGGPVTQPLVEAFFVTLG